MTHPRQLIRHAIADAVSGVASRVRPTSDAELPCRLVYTLSEQSSQVTIKGKLERKLDAVRGPVQLDLATRSPIQNIYIKKVEKKEMFGYGKPELWNTVIKTYPNVSQFWTYDEKKYLAQPVYSRNFPPLKS